MPAKSESGSELSSSPNRASKLSMSATSWAPAESFVLVGGAVEAGKPATLAKIASRTLVESNARPLGALDVGSAGEVVVAVTAPPVEERPVAAKFGELPDSATVVVTVCEPPLE